MSDQNSETVDSENGPMSSNRNAKEVVQIQFQRLNKLFTYSPSMNLIFPNPQMENDPDFHNNRESSKRNFDEFRRIFRQRSELKFEFVCQNLMEKILALKRTCLGLINDQKRTVTGQTTLKNMTLISTYVEYLPRLCEEAKHIFVSWIQVKVALLSNKWVQTRFNQNLDKYDMKSVLFFSIAVDVGRYLKSVFGTGTKLMCGLSANKINEKFCKDFVAALNDYNSYIFMVNFYSNRDSTSSKLETISLQGFLTDMARYNGIALAETLSTKVAKYCNTFSKLEENKSTDPTSLESIVHNEMDQKLKQVKFKDSHETSDYYSSSASSSKTLPDNNITNATKHLPRIPFSSQTKFSKKLQQFYSHFFQQIFLFFDSFVKSSYSDQFSTENLPKNDTEGKQQMEDVLQTEKKLMWKNCVSITWENFLTEMQTICKLGLHRIPSLMTTDENTTCALLDFIVDLALVVPLPEEMCPVKPLLVNLQNLLLSTSWLTTTDSCQKHIYMDKTLQPFLNSGKLKLMLDLGKFSNENVHFSSKQLFQNFTFCKTLWSLSSYNLQLLIAIFCQYQTFSDNKETQFHVWLKSRLASKTSSVTMEALRETFPDGKVWKRIRGEPVEANEYVPYLTSSVLEPFKLTQDSFGESCLPLMEIIVDQMFQTWLEFVKKKGIKFRPEAVKQLKFDFETTKLWVFDNLCSTQTTKDSVQKLNVFTKVDTIFDILSDTFSSKNELTAPSALFSNTKVAPEMLDKDNDYNEKVLFKVIPEAFEWRKLRKRNGVACLPCL